MKSLLQDYYVCTVRLYGTIRSFADTVRYRTILVIILMYILFSRTVRYRYLYLYAHTIPYGTVPRDVAYRVSSGTVRYRITVINLSDYQPGVTVRYHDTKTMPASRTHAYKSLFRSRF